MSRILVVDDEPLIGQLLEEWLVELGHEPVGPAFSVKSALALINSADPDCAILDVSLGTESSFAVADILADRGTPVAFATGRGGDTLPARFHNATMLAKPFDFDALKRVVQKMTSGR